MDLWRRRSASECHAKFFIFRSGPSKVFFPSFVCTCLPVVREKDEQIPFKQRLSKFNELCSMAIAPIIFSTDSSLHTPLPPFPPPQWTLSDVLATQQQCCPPPFEPPPPGASPSPPPSNAIPRPAQAPSLESPNVVPTKQDEEDALPMPASKFVCLVLRDSWDGMSPVAWVSF